MRAVDDSNTSYIPPLTLRVLQRPLPEANALLAPTKARGTNSAVRLVVVVAAKHLSHPRPPTPHEPPSLSYTAPSLVHASSRRALRTPVLCLREEWMSTVDSTKPNHCRPIFSLSPARFGRRGRDHGQCADWHPLAARRLGASFVIDRTRGCDHCNMGTMPLNAEL